VRPAGLITLLIGEKLMQNDEIHIKAQAEARYYLDIKQKEREEKREQFIFKVLVTAVVLLFSIIIIAPIAG
tara:strand:+ start:1633 stop:1845 length:213 start_codon:yes stop_codon:yes gene_type:complete